MTAYSLSLPSDLLDEIRQMADENNVSLDQWLLSAIVEKAGAVKTQRLLQQYAAKFDDAQFTQVLAKVPDVDPLPGDEL